MKRTINNLLCVAIVIAATLSFTSCSSDDDNGGPTGPQVSTNLYGNWTMSFRIFNGETEFDLSCEQQLDYKFNSDKTYTKKEFATNSNDNCVESNVTNGTWEAITENSITLTPYDASETPEIIDFEFVNNDNDLRVERTQNLIEIYERP